MNDDADRAHARRGGDDHLPARAVVFVASAACGAESRVRRGGGSRRPAFPASRCAARRGGESWSTSGSHRVLPPASAADEPPAVPDVSAGAVCEPASVSLEVSSSSTKPPARYPEASPVAAVAAHRWRTAPCRLGRSPATVSRRCTDAAGIPGAIAPCDEFLPCSSGTSNRKQGRGARPPVTAVPNTSHRRRTWPGPSERGTG